MENFIRKVVHRCTGRLHSIHQRLLNIDVEKLPGRYQQNPYQLFLVWLLDVSVYGLITTFILNTWFGWLGWRNVPLIFANGMFVWLTTDYVRQMKTAIKD
jgi:hypothetical protein